MKKSIGLLVILVLTAATAVQAQGVRLGLKAGLNNREMKFDNSVFYNTNRFGWFAGPVLKVSLPTGGFGFDIAGLYDQYESKLNDETITQKSIVVPVNARLNIGLGSEVGIYLAAGPQFGFNIGNDEFSWKDKNNYDNTFQLKKSYFSINLGAGTYISKHLEIGFTYNIALGKTGDASFKDSVKSITDDNKIKTWTLSACYYF